MKRLLLVLAATSLLLAPAAHAAKGDRKKATTANEAHTALLKKFDANSDGKLEGAELEAARKDFATTTDLNLKGLDKDADGKLSDTELSALSSAAPKKVKKKKNQE